MISSRQMSTIVEGADYLLDLKTNDPSNNRENCVRLKAAMKGIDMDECYASFLNEFLDLCEAKFVEDEEEEDLTYRMFLNNLKEHGNAYMADVSVEHGVFSPIVYEDEDDLSGKLRRKTRRSSKSPLFRETKSLGLDGDVRNGVKRIHCSSAEQNCRSNLRSSKVDDAYKVFLNDLKVDGQSVFYEYEPGKRVFYEMSGEKRMTDVDIPLSTTASRTKVALRTQCGTPRPTPPPRPLNSALRKPTPTSIPRQSAPDPISKVHQSLCNASMLKSDGTVSQSDHTWFWKALEDFVRKPYNQEEYEDYWQKITDRRPVEVHRETRTGGYQSAPGQMGKSYLEVYPDLKCEIKRVKTDRLKVLNLLRSFFFYLKSIPHGVPKPWMSDSGKEILLGSRL